MPTIVYFQIPSDDIERSKKFYTQLFGWKIDKSPEANTPEGMENWSITTTDHNGKEALGGGMSKRQMPQQQITNFIDVRSVDEYLSKVERLGGKVVVPKTAVPGMGYYAVCLDTENNSFGIFGSSENVK
jgi:predicted enzyme related to lactoylglutathione lyase